VQFYIAGDDCPPKADEPMAQSRRLRYHSSDLSPQDSKPSKTYDMANRVTIISNSRDCFIEVINRDVDPSSWIVRRSKKLLWFKRRVSSDWFLNRQQAFAFAEKMREECSEHHHSKSPVQQP
jgi:hypothetical protein